jgi:hypothetical protein
MSTRLYRSISEPIREDLSYEERWHGIERALITCWEVGRAQRVNDLQEMKTRAGEAEPPEQRGLTLTERATAGELPKMGWVGGVSQKLTGKKYGSLHYLAQWQGLRGEDLDIDLSQELSLVCSRMGVAAIFTADTERWGR